MIVKCCAAFNDSQSGAARFRVAGEAGTQFRGRGDRPTRLHQQTLPRETTADHFDRQVGANM
jgi:hypothetical protein